MNIINCPYCTMQGKTKNLANILDNGDIKINRLSQEGDNSIIDSTIIRGSHLSIVCGDCQNSIVYRVIKPVTPQLNVVNMWGTIFNYYVKGSN